MVYIGKLLAKVFYVVYLFLQIFERAVGEKLVERRVGGFQFAEELAYLQGLYLRLIGSGFQGADKRIQALGFLLIGVLGYIFVIVEHQLDSVVSFLFGFRFGIAIRLDTVL